MSTQNKKYAPFAIEIFCIIVAPLEKQLIDNSRILKGDALRHLLPILPPITIHFNSILDYVPKIPAIFLGSIPHPQVMKMKNTIQEC